MPVSRTIAEGRKRVDQLVSRFKANAAGYLRSGSTYNETTMRIEFLNPLLQALGWDVENEDGRPQDLREVVYEPTVEGQTEKPARRPDYEMRLFRQRKFFIEAKKPSINIEVEKAPAIQVREYGFSGGVPVSILTNFHRFIVYDCRPLPQDDDGPQVARDSSFTVEDLAARFAEIHGLFSREAVFSGEFDRQFSIDIHRRGSSQFDDFFLAQVKSWRERLAVDIEKRNAGMPDESLTFVVQRLLNRIIFLRICEDRDLEKYETLKTLGSNATYQRLKQLLRRADKKYNSGIFRLLEGHDSAIVVSDQVLFSIIEELYRPRSPYKFSVVDPAVLGEIYESFLAHEIRVGSDGMAAIVEKPEVKAAGGVATTPGYIVDQIVRRTLTPKLEGRSPAELEDFAIADIACGSGVFLLRAFASLLEHYIGWYVGDGAEQHRDVVYEAAPNQWKLFLHEKRRILLRHIYGVDIDPQAVEVARFSLLLKLIEDETSESVAAHQLRFHEPALPSLDDHVVRGNSLVDPDAFAKYMPNAGEALLLTVDPLDWEREFPQTGGRFDVIVGNPPYIRIQNMTAYSPDEVKFFQSDDSGFQCSRADNFDKYALFIERGFHLLRPDGRLGYIVPNKFATIKSGERTRDLISSERALDELVQFGAQQVFDGSSTYTCIIVLVKASRPHFAVEQVKDLRRWRYGDTGAVDRHASNEITAEPWEFIPDDAKLLFTRLRSAHTSKLSDVADIFVGMQTSADKIYIVRAIEVDSSVVTFVDKNGERRAIERGILRPCLLDAPLEAFSQPVPNSFIVFPYHIENGEATLYGQKELQEMYPLAWNYLGSFKDILKQRSIQNGTPATWYRYGRSQSLTKFDREKLILPVLSIEPRCAYDAANIVVTGGGNGPYYLVRPRTNTRLSIFFLQALLCHPVFEAMIRSKASTFRGGYYSHGKQFVKDLPIREIDFGDPEERRLHDEIVSNVKKLIEAASRRTAAKTPRQGQVWRRQRDRLLGETIACVNRLYDITDADLTIAQNVQIST